MEPGWAPETRSPHPRAHPSGGTGMSAVPEWPGLEGLLGKAGRSTIPLSPKADPFQRSLRATPKVSNPPPPLLPGLQVSQAQPPAMNSPSQHALHLPPALGRGTGEALQTRHGASSAVTSGPYTLGSSCPSHPWNPHKRCGFAAIEQLRVRLPPAHRTATGFCEHRAPKTLRVIRSVWNHGRGRENKSLLLFNRESRCLWCRHTHHPVHHRACLHPPGLTALPRRARPSHLLIVL